MRCYWNVMWLYLLVSAPAIAAVPSAGEIKIIAELQAMYTQMMDQVQQLKSQNETLQSVKQGINDSVTTYYQIKNLSVERIVRRIRQDIDGLTQLDDLEGLSLEKRILTIQREINRRVADPRLSPEERERLEQENKLLESINKRSEILTEMTTNAVDNMAKASLDIGTKDSGRITAESVSILVQIEAMRELDRAEQKRAKIQDQQIMSNLNQQAKKIVEATSESGW